MSISFDPAICLFTLEKILYMDAQGCVERFIFRNMQYNTIVKNWKQYKI